MLACGVTVQCFNVTKLSDADILAQKTCIASECNLGFILFLVVQH